MPIKIFSTLCVFYHVLATVAAIAGAYHLLRMSLGRQAYNPVWKHALRNGELHLWISGLLIVAIGVYLNGLAYLQNPKLWTKVSLIAVWGINSLLIKAYLKKVSLNGRSLFLGISLASLLYGTFLGVAKPLANGVAPFSALLLGYLLTMAISTASMHRFLKAPQSASGRFGDVAMS